MNCPVRKPTPLAPKKNHLSQRHQDTEKSIQKIQSFPLHNSPFTLQPAIAYAHPEKHDASTFTLSAHQFISRILNHVPEKGTHVVRAYGLFHPNCRVKLDAARKHLGQGPYVPKSKIPSTSELLSRMFPDQDLGRCPYCKAELRTVFICRGGQARAVKLAA